MHANLRKGALALSALAALALGGSAVAGAASGTTTGSATAAPTTAPPTAPTGRRPAFNGPAHGTAAHENAETAVTGADAVKAQEAAVKSVGAGSKAGAVTRDFTGTGYETTVTKSDGTTVDVHMDGSFTVMSGGPGGPGGPGGADGTH